MDRPKLNAILSIKSISRPGNKANTKTYPGMKSIKGNPSTILNAFMSRRTAGIMAILHIKQIIISTG